MASDNTSVSPLPIMGPRQAAPAGIPSLKDKIPKLEPRRRRQTPSNPLPFPETPALPPPPADPWAQAFKVPTRRILSKSDHDLFLASPTFALVLAFVFGLSESVADTPSSAVKDGDVGGTARMILGILDEAEELVRQWPPNEAGGSRFGNKAFRSFLDAVKERSPKWHTQLGIQSDTAAQEVSAYLLQSFGNKRRIDYGSGHELNFVMWLLCLYRLRLLTRDDFKVLVLRVFARYLDLMRVIQSTYYLEPAGSHGVWGLDDYQFLPFLFGASQLLHHPYISPMAIHQELTLEEFGADYLYLGQVAFVNSTKTVRGLRWHSPMLDDISSAKSWAKVEGGMRRMFVAEVLGKLPVMQHFLFGSLVPAVEGMSAEEGAGAASEDDADEEGEVVITEDEDGAKRVHQHVGWGDCCGIKVPSGIAAAQELKKRGGSELRRIPFD